MKQGIVGFGECVVDFIPVGEEDGCTLYKACPGGSVANLCVVAARLGVPSAFVGGVGNDAFGRFLKKRVAEYGVQTSNMAFTDECGTNLTFVHLAANMQREYSSVNKPGAEKMVHGDMLNMDFIGGYSVLHVSSNAMVCGPTRETQPMLMAEAKRRGMFISYDVNYRPNFYKSVEEALQVLRAPLEQADLVKVTEEELELLTGGQTKAHAEKLLAGGAKIVLLTRGENGADYYTANARGHVAACRVDAVDTTGAGDCFLGGFLSAMLTNGGLQDLSPERVERACAFGNKVAGLSVTRVGAMSGVPTRAEVDAFAAQSR